MIFARRILKLLTRLGHLIEEDGLTYMARSESLDPDDVLAPLQAASSTWRIAAGPRAGRKVLTLVGRNAQRFRHSLPHANTAVGTAVRSDLLANAQGFSLHAGVHCAADDLRLVKRDNVWAKIMGSYFLSKNKPHYPDVTPMAKAMVAAAPDRMVWGSDWPHPGARTNMPDDGDLANQFGGWVADEALRKRILVDNPARLYGF